MMVAPAKTPKDVVDRLHAGMKRVMALSDIQQQVARMGLIAVDTPSPGELQRFGDAEIGG
jgi:tripartite-type tricarboxylate transporter receptor subunit TctC